MQIRGTESLPKKCENRSVRNFVDANDQNRLDRIQESVKTEIPYQKKDPPELFE